MTSNIPLIEQLQVSPEERELTFKKVKYLLKVHQEGSVNSANITRLFEEWKNIATRINKGGKMIEKTAESGVHSEESQNYMTALADLYTLQLKLLGIYEMFFKKHLRPEQYERARNQVCELVLK